MNQKKCTLHYLSQENSNIKISKKKQYYYLHPAPHNLTSTSEISSFKVRQSYHFIYHFIETIFPQNKFL